MSREDPKETGQRCSVLRNDTWHPATVLHHRAAERKRESEYYVHYDGLDKRLDEWVPAERLRFDSEDQQINATETTAADSQHRTTRITRRSESANEEERLNGDSRKVTEQLDKDTVTNSEKVEHDKCRVSHGRAAKTDPSAKQSKVDQSSTASKFERSTRALNKRTRMEEPVSGDPTFAALELEHEALTRVKYIERVQFGRYEIDAWYFSPYPDEFGRSRKLFVCEFCLKYTRFERTYRAHMAECKTRVPTNGKEIYRKGSLSVYEVDGAEAKVYSQNLCLLAKLFLDHKTLYFDVETFLFYVLCEMDASGAHLVGYFSKEKDSPEQNNVACILTLPPFQRKGYGKFLIAFSYELSKREGIAGGPEKPLSDLGRLSYRSYWSYTLLDILCEYRCCVSLKEVSQLTAIAYSDVISTLQSMGLLRYWKGQHVICVSPRVIEEQLKTLEHRRPSLLVDPDCLRWSPPLKIPRTVKQEVASAAAGLPLRTANANTNSNANAVPAAAAAKRGLKRRNTKKSFDRFANARRKLKLRRAEQAREQERESSPDGDAQDQEDVPANTIGDASAQPLQSTEALPVTLSDGVVLDCIPANE